VVLFDLPMKNGKRGALNTKAKQPLLETGGSGAGQ